MYKRIREYVEFVFKNKDIENKEDLIEEVTTNLYERYLEKFEIYHDEEKAYIEAIKQMGDFDFDEEKIEKKYYYQPSWAHIALNVSFLISIFTILVLFLNTLVGVIMLIISIGLYLAASQYLYHNALYALNTEKNFEKHNSYLSDIFKPLKKNFILWNISSSYVLGKLTASLLTLLIVLINPWFVWNPIVYFIVNLLFVVLFFIISYKILERIYEAIEVKYYVMTKEKDIKIEKTNAKDIKYVNLEKVKIVFNRLIKKSIQIFFSPWTLLLLTITMAIVTEFLDTEYNNNTITLDQQGSIYYVIIGIKVFIVLMAFVNLKIKSKNLTSIIGYSNIIIILGNYFLFENYLNNLGTAVLFNNWELAISLIVIIYMIIIQIFLFKKKKD